MFRRVVSILLLLCVPAMQLGQCQHSHSEANHPGPAGVPHLHLPLSVPCSHGCSAEHEADHPAEEESHPPCPAESEEILLSVVSDLHVQRDADWYPLILADLVVPPVDATDSWDGFDRSVGAWCHPPPTQFSNCPRYLSLLTLLI
jgi:hypothetical protein